MTFAKELVRIKSKHNYFSTKILQARNSNASIVCNKYDTKPVTEFQSTDILIAATFFKTNLSFKNGLQCAKNVITLWLTTYQIDIAEFHNLLITDRVRVVMYRCWHLPRKYGWPREKISKTIHYTYLFFLLCNRYPIRFHKMEGNIASSHCRNWKSISLNTWDLWWW